MSKMDSKKIKKKNITFSEKTEKNEENKENNTLLKKNNTIKEENTINSIIFKKIPLEKKKYEKNLAINLSIKAKKYLIVLDVTLVQLLLILFYIGLMVKMIEDGVYFVNKITTELMILNIILFFLIITK